MPVGAGNYKPEEEIQKKYCKTDGFRSCPRFVAIHEYLGALKGK